MDAKSYPQYLWFIRACNHQTIFGSGVPVFQGLVYCFGAVWCTLFWGSLVYSVLGQSGVTDFWIWCTPLVWSGVPAFVKF